jgi:DNA invertase Pin-like site-specific DNA recombinase
VTRAALYLRVSTVEQTEVNQLPDLDRLCAARGWEPVEYRETGSAAKVRPVLDRLMVDARAGRIGAVVVWALDRLDRNMVACLLRVAELDRLGVAVVSARESWLDTSGPARSLLVAVFGWVAEQERARLIERTRAGIARARAEGVTIGRPRASPVLLHAAADRVRDTGCSVRTAATYHGVPEATLRRFMRERGARASAAP